MITQIQYHQLKGSVVKVPCRVATTGDVTLTGAPNSVDGISLSLYDRILVHNQSSGQENGVYYVKVLGTGSDGEWVRSNDFSQNFDVYTGIEVYVSTGSTYSNKYFILSTSNPITLDTTPLTFVENTFSSGTSGTSGISGTSGAQGTSGTSGNNGTSGTSGKDGTSGTSGKNGSSGTSGTSGKNGSSGTSGTSGKNGSSGTSGTSGKNGSSGTSGTSGKDGTSGTSGKDGTSGITGTSGVSGTSGTSAFKIIEGTPGDDLSYDGIVSWNIYIENLTEPENRLLYLRNDGVYDLALASSTATMPCTAMLAGDADPPIIHFGYVTNANWNFPTIGSLLYVDNITAGAVTTSTTQFVTGDQVQIVGYVVSGDTVFFNPNYMLIEIQ